jgi:hypothetical protein
MPRRTPNTHLLRSPSEIAEKMALYFETGAREVWTCDQDGTLEFHFSICGGG